MRVTNKRENYRLYHQGAYGNRLRSWDTLEEVRSALGRDYRGTLAIRYKEPGSRFFQFDIAGYAELCGQVARLEGEGADRRLMAFSEQADDRLIVIQGEAQRSERYVDLVYSMVKRPMRLAFQEDKRLLTGAAAVLVLQEWMDDPSWSNLWRLWEDYDDGVVEFSTYSRGVGLLGWNTYFWEVRHY